MEMVEYENVFPLTDGRRRNKFAFLLLKDAKFRKKWRSLHKEWRLLQRNGYEIGDPLTMRELCANSSDLLKLMEMIKKEFAYVRILNELTLGREFVCCDGTYLMYLGEPDNRYKRDFSPSKEGEKYIAYTRDGHRLRQTAAALYAESISLCVGDGVIPNSVANRAAELFADEWKAFVCKQQGEYKLVINDDFDALYDSELCKGDFHSCMTDTGYEVAYMDFDGAQACYLEDKAGYIVARAILWSKVRSRLTPNKTYIYLDRQYSSDGRRDLREVLIDKVKTYLDEKGQLDGFLYKPSDCSCTDALNIWDRSDCRIKEDFASSLYVRSELVADSTVCYMDTFKYLDLNSGVVSTSEQSPNDVCLETTDGQIELNQEWSEFEDCYIPSDCAEWSEWYYSYIFKDRSVWSDSLSSYVYEDDDEIVVVNGDYYSIHNEDIVYCDYIGEYKLREDCVFTEDTEEYILEEDSVYCNTDGTYYRYEENVPEYDLSPCVEIIEDIKKEEDAVEKTARLVVLKDGDLREIEYPLEILRKDLLNIAHLYGIKGLDWYDAHGVLRLYCKGTLEGTPCESTWRYNFLRVLEQYGVQRSPQEVEEVYNSTNK